MCKKDYYEKNKDILSNKAKEYYKNNRDVLYKNYVLYEN